MQLAGAGLCSFPVVPGNNSAQPLFPLDLTFCSRREIRAQYLVSNICSLMRAFIVVIRQPLPIDVVKL